MKSLHILLTASLLLCLSSSILSEEVQSPHPNVLMICIDDLNDWVGCLGGHPQVKTPAIDQLAASGVNFTNAHCVVPVCTCSRVSVMSGLHATTHGSYEFGPSYQSIAALESAATMQEYFKAQGYITLAGGKVLHHGFTGRLSSAIDIKLGRHGGPRPKKQMNWPGKAWDWGAFPEKDQQMFDFQLATKAAAALQKDYDQPFFLSVGLFRPHVPMFVPQKWFDLYDRENIILPKAPPSDLEDVPAYFRGRTNIEPIHAEVVKTGNWRGMVHAYLASTSFVDHCVGKIIQGLNEGPHKQNTIVVLWSDHGFHLGEKQKWAKRTLWEESTRVPLIVSAPGVNKAQACQEAVSLLDIYPTLLEMCQLPANTKLDGLSLVPQLKDVKTAREQPVLISSYFGNHALRSKDWRYIRYRDETEELYNHREDPDEFTNLAADPRFAAEKAELKKWLPKNPAKEVKQQK